MKLPPTFRIDTSRNKPCTQGGFNHNARPVLDKDGFPTADKCVHCGHETPRKKVKKVRVKGTIIL